ncbi:hypothetical protein [Macrococcus equipercicus]|uniref:Uncharacterized protein n=1 Tax=Macrococcus equipercicus TaxID=69967 RepID=A0A9Q9BUN4_9STAP|nr:hypothetical protein [Macrococcus equipercicus]KAA1037670.1 hypothetical protein ERX35_008915 [Macrococcus equipercicus]UTH13382.1 hypothetical protein KFV11_09115 [Macrococcus equipercicus]
MNEVINLVKYVPYMLRNIWIELRYHLQQYIIFLSANMIVIVLALLLLNLMGSMPIDRSTRIFQLSGYVMLLWIAGSIIISNLILPRKGFILNITNLPVYVLVNIQIINFFFTFLISFLLLLVIKSISGIQLETSWLGVVYFIALTYLLLMPVCILVSLFRQKPVIIGSAIAVLFLTLPILWVPSMMPTGLLNILKLNPFYFLVNGFQESVVLGTSAFYNYPNHLLFIFELVLIYLWTGYFYKLMKDEINMNKTN